MDSLVKQIKDRLRGPNFNRLSKTPLTCRLWSKLPPTGVRGPLVQKDTEWPHGSRQVRRRAMFQMYFSLFSHYDAPRKARRLMARRKAVSVYQSVGAEMLSSTGTLVLTKAIKQVAWYQTAFKRAKELFV